MERQQGLPAYWPIILAVSVLFILGFFAFRILRPVPKAEQPLVQESVQPQIDVSQAVEIPPPGQPSEQIPTFISEHTVQSGETLSIIAGLYGTTVNELVRVNNLANPDLLEPGQRLILPGTNAGTVTSPSDWLLADSDLVYGPAANGFDVASFIQQQGGYLSQHQEIVEGTQLNGAQIVQLVADRFSVDPRLLLAFIEYRSNWVTNGTSEAYPLDYTEAGYEGLHQQLRRTANQLNFGFYGRAEGGLTGFQLRDGTTVNFAENLNIGSAGVMNALASHSAGNYASWQYDVGANGLMATYARLFGNPFERQTVELVPANLTQPPLALPWSVGETWYFTGGPHGAWATGSAWAGIDFAPPGEQLNCYVSDYFVTAMSAGTVVRSGMGAVVVDLDGDGYAGTGWTLFYMHLDTQDRVPLGATVNVGDAIGRPSCEGGFSNGTHVHLARSYNGRWLSADSSTLPFNLDGWVSQGFGEEYQGSLIKNGVTVTAANGRYDNGILR